MKSFNRLFILFSVLSVATKPVFAFEREHGAHEHGHAKIMIAMEGGSIDMEFHSPAVNLVGFEHQAISSEDKQKLAETVKRLSSGDLFIFDDAAQCILVSADVASELLGNKHDEDHDAGDAENDDHHGEVHSEFEVSYHIDCKNIAVAKKIEVKLFSAFPSLMAVEAEIAGASSQKMIKLNAKNTVIPLK